MTGITEAQTQDAENTKPKELITPVAIKNRVMEFFRDVDLNHEGNTKNGLITIRTTTYPHINEVKHSATINGYQLADYDHNIAGTESVPLSNGEDRWVAEYLLYGDYGNGTLSLRLREFKNKPAEIILDHPGNAGSMARRGPLEKFDELTKKIVAEQLLELKN